MSMIAIQSNETLQRRRQLITVFKHVQENDIPIRSLSEFETLSGVRSSISRNTGPYLDIRREVEIHITRSKLLVIRRIEEAIDSILSPGPQPEQITRAMILRTAELSERERLTASAYQRVRNRMQAVMAESRNRKNAPRAALSAVSAVMKKMTWEEYMGNRLEDYYG